MVVKTVILVRHAQSEENVKIMAAQDGLRSIRKLRLPSRDQVSKTVSLARLAADEPLSTVGKAQVADVCQQIERSSFISKFNPQLICHSKLQRARDTCRGLFPSSAHELEYITLDAFDELSPMEQMIGDRRIGSFEKWLMTRSEERIVAVGHSRYLKRMLKLDKLMDNCTVLKVFFHHDAANDPKGSTSCRWEVGEVLYSLKSPIPPLPAENSELSVVV